MKDLERLVAYGSIVGSTIYGWQHQALWLLVPLGAFALLVIVQDRQLRLRIGDRHWPSEGFARFSMGTNLYLLLRNSFLNALVFLAAGAARSLVGA